MMMNEGNSIPILPHLIETYIGLDNIFLCIVIFYAILLIWEIKELL